jgi:uncharacterized membrane protein YgdD (TMEM256/DUF423 family)
LCKHGWMTTTRIAAVLGFLGVALGAFGAHGLKAILEANATMAIWQTAVLYHLVHAVAALWASEKRPAVVWIWTAGIVIFSGSLYILAVTNVRWLGAITPIGGILFLIGWVMIAFKPKQEFEGERAGRREEC